MKTSNNLAEALERGFPSVRTITQSDIKRLKTLEAIRLHNEGLYSYEIAKIMGCTPATVKNYLRQSGIEPRLTPTYENREKVNKRSNGRFAHLK